MNFFLNKKLIYFLFFLFFSFLKTNYALSNDKIYLDLLSVKFDNKINYKKYQTSTQLLTKTDLDKEMKNWIEQNIVLKGNSGELTVQILDESVIDEKMPINLDVAIDMAHDVATQGIFVGQSSGAYLVAANEIAKREDQAVIVTIFNDLGERYFSTGMWNR